eukprot:scaffold43311_cov34-Phaeocystis_antarctica.AAC.3
MPKAVAKVDPAKEAAKAAAKVEKACNDLVKACKDDALSKAKKGAAPRCHTPLPHPALPPLHISHHQPSSLPRSGGVGRRDRSRRHRHRLHPHAHRCRLRQL